LDLLSVLHKLKNFNSLINSNIFSAFLRLMILFSIGQIFIEKWDECRNAVAFRKPTTNEKERNPK